jgi:sugar (pentulose or hexulose) kinase
MKKIILDARGAVFVDKNGAEVRIIAWPDLRDYDWTEQFEAWIGV